MKPSALLLTAFFILFLFAFGFAQETRPDDTLSAIPAEPAPQPKPADEAAPKSDYKGPLSVGVKYLEGFTAKISGATFGWVDDIYVDKKRGELYILDDRNKRIVITDSNGIYLYHFDYKHAKLNAPKGVVVDSTGDIYTYEWNKITVLNYRGVFKKEFDISQVPDKDNLSIQSIAIFNPPSSSPLFQGGAGIEGERIYIGDNKKSRIIVLSKDGKFIREYGKDVIKGQNFKNLYVDENGFLFLDAGGHAVHRYNHDGKLIKRWGKLSGLLGGFSLPAGMAVDKENKRVIVADANRMLVVVFDMFGNPLFEFGGPGIFSWPRTVAVNAQGHIYVADNTGVIRVFEAVEIVDDMPPPLDQPEPQMPAEGAGEDKDKGEDEPSQ